MHDAGAGIKMKAAQWAALETAHPDIAPIPLQLREQAIELCVATGTLVAGLGTRPQYMYFIHAGEIRLQRLSIKGVEIVLQRCASGFVAEASLESTAYHCDIVAVDDSDLLCFPIALFREQLRADDSFARYWMSTLAREVRSLRARCERLALRSARERVQHYIEAEGRNGQFELRQSRKAWAAELGLTHEALYRTLSAMVAADTLVMATHQGKLLLTLKAV